MKSRRDGLDHGRGRVMSVRASAEDALQTQRTLELLSSLSYRSGDLTSYLEQIVNAVSELINVDWSVVTLLCQDNSDRVLASNRDLGGYDRIYALHGTVTENVVRSGTVLVVDDIKSSPECGQMPEGYRAYLGLPLRLPSGEVIGTICSFHAEARRFSEAERRIAGLFAERAAVAIDNFQLYQKQREFNSRLEQEVASRTADLQAAQDRLLESERLRAIGEFAATIVHEIRSPLSAMSLLVDYLSAQPSPDATRKRIALASNELERLRKLLDEILVYARPQKLERQSVDLSELIPETLETVLAMAVAQERTVRYAGVRGTAQVFADRDKLKQVLINLLVNAAEAIAPGEGIDMQVFPGEDDKSRCVEIRNGGEPIPPRFLARLTEPFLTTKRLGSGLGLAIVKRIVDSHGGTLQISSAPGQGTRVRVCLPLPEGEVAST